MQTRFTPKADRPSKDEDGQNKDNCNLRNESIKTEKDQHSKQDTTDSGSSKRPSRHKLNRRDTIEAGLLDAIEEHGE